MKLLKRWENVILAFSRLIFFDVTAADAGLPSRDSRMRAGKDFKKLFDLVNSYFQVSYFICLFL